MSESTPKENSLVLYKSHPARVLSITDKLNIELKSGATKRVRFKDLRLLHEGPLKDLGSLQPQIGEVQEAWELLVGTSSNLAELSELVFGSHTPSTAWAAWQLVMDGLYFYGKPDELMARLPDEVIRERETREAKATAKREWSEFLSRLQTGKILPKDASKLSDVEALARGKHKKSHTLRKLGRPETQINAHALLLKTGYWDETVNPYPDRQGLPTEPLRLSLPELPDEQRLDLTHLDAFAIDDEGNKDPDDAISLDGDRIWVHIADVSALVKPESELDLEARGRGATLYLPERSNPMLGFEAIDKLGLGLNETSPALSFSFVLGDQGEITNIDVARTRVRVTRISYAEAETRLSSEPFKQLKTLAWLFRDRRKANGAIQLQFPEVAVRVIEGEAHIYPLPALDSRAIVTECMLMAGEAAAHFAQQHDIPFPYTTQASPESPIQQPQDMAEMFACRKLFKRSQMKTTPESHSGLGLNHYSQVTSPLRRYLDLVAHQQLCAYILGETMLSEQEVMMRVGSAEAIIWKIRRADRLSITHWKLVYLKHHPQWCGRGIVVERRGPRTTVLIPELGLDVNVSIAGSIKNNSEIDLAVEKIDLPTLSAYFRAQN
ncbi:MAG: RNB domain-containing ribonuclease [Gammaproteobacteria bacterium]|nr:RNB domain-containing ribonuclease [Gammaproteobacteria bacterium]